MPMARLNQPFAVFVGQLIENLDQMPGERLEVIRELLPMQQVRAELVVRGRKEAHFRTQPSTQINRQKKVVLVHRPAASWKKVSPR